MSYRMSRSAETTSFWWIPICLILVILLSFAVSNAADPPAAKVDVRPSSSVDRDMVMLGDIAAIDGGDPQLVARLKSVTVARSPLPGSSRNLSAGEVMVRLKQAGIDTARIHLNAPAVASIT